jgi:hypothetical protein
VRRVARWSRACPGLDPGPLVHLALWWRSGGALVALWWRYHASEVSCILCAEFALGEVVARLRLDASGFQPQLAHAQQAQASSLRAVQQAAARAGQGYQALTAPQQAATQSPQQMQAAGRGGGHAVMHVHHHGTRHDAEAASAQDLARGEQPSVHSVLGHVRAGESSAIMRMIRTLQR